MTDITDQELRDAIEWGRRNEYSGDPAEANAAIVILATVDAPEPTIAEELRHIAEHWEEWQTATITSAIKAAADSAEQAEQERDEARAEVKRLNRERDRLQAQVQGLARRDGYHNSEVRMLTEERDEARAEVERLTAVQKGAESNAESIDPADVKPGEPWLIRVRGRDAVAIRDGHEEWPWSVAFIHGESDEAKDDVVTLVSRLVPAPRVITNPDDLDALGHRTVILSTDGQADVYQKDSNGEWVDVTAYGCSSRRVIRMEGAVTVLWEPEA